MIHKTCSRSSLINPSVSPSEFFATHLYDPKSCGDNFLIFRIMYLLYPLSVDMASYFSPETVISTFVHFLQDPVISLLTRDDHIAFFCRPKVYGRRKRFRVTLQLDVLTNIATHQLIGNGQHWRNYNRIVKYKLVPVVNFIVT